MVDWDGNNVRYLADGSVSDGWRDGNGVNGPFIAHQAMASGESVAAGIIISPSSVSMRPGDTKDFNAEVLDQFGNKLDPQPSISWSASGGTIDGDGVFTAPEQKGEYTVAAESEGLSVSAPVTVSSAMVITMTSSHAGKTYYRGETITIRWECNEDIGMNVWLLVDEGVTPIPLNPLGSVSTAGGEGSWEWTVDPNEFGGEIFADKAVFKVEPYWPGEEPVFAISGAFNIVDEKNPGAIQPGMPAATHVRIGVRAYTAEQASIQLGRPGAFTVELFNMIGTTLLSRHGHTSTCRETIVFGRTLVSGVYWLKISDGSAHFLYRMRVVR